MTEADDKQQKAQFKKEVLEDFKELSSSLDKRSGVKSLVEKVLNKHLKNISEDTFDQVQTSLEPIVGKGGARLLVLASSQLGIFNDVLKIGKREYGKEIKFMRKIRALYSPQMTLAYHLGKKGGCHLQSVQYGVTELRGEDVLHLDLRRLDDKAFQVNIGTKMAVALGVGIIQEVEKKCPQKVEQIKTASKEPRNQITPIGFQCQKETTEGGEK